MPMYFYINLLCNGKLEEFLSNVTAGFTPMQIATQAVNAATSLELSFIGDILGIYRYSGKIIVPDEDFRKSILSHLELIAGFDSSVNSSTVVCECGSEKVGSNAHSGWCPKGKYAA